MECAGGVACTPVGRDQKGRDCCSDGDGDGGDDGGHGHGGDMLWA